MSEFIKINEADFSNLKFSKNKNVNGTRFLLAYYDKKIVGLKLPTLRIPFDTKLNPFNNTQLEIILSLDKNIDLINKFNELDDSMKQYAVDNNWFDSSTKFEYTPVLKNSTNNDFPPTIKIKIPIKDNNIETLFYDINKDKIVVKNNDDIMNLLRKNVQVQTAIRCSCVWFKDNKFGISWKAEQIRIIKSNDNNDNECIFDSDLSDDDISETDCLIDD